MANAILIDTNILVYAYDLTDVSRSERAQVVLRNLEETGAGRISVQTLAEFASVATRKLKPPLTATEAQKQIELFVQSYPVIPLTPSIVIEAVRGVGIHQFAYYDAQIWATARLNQISTIFSEDIPSAEIIEGVRYINPFTEIFAIEEWI